MTEFPQQVQKFSSELTRFILANHLPVNWFGSPDHLAIKCADAEDFNNTTAHWKGHTLDNTINVTEIHGRRLATAQINGRIPIGALGGVELLEIMEPRPDRLNNGLVGVDHLEFYYPYENFYLVRGKLSEKDIPFIEPADNPSRNCIVVPINELGQEFKLTDIPLRIIVPKELEEGIAYLV